MPSTHLVAGRATVAPPPPLTKICRDCKGDTPFDELKTGSRGKRGNLCKPCDSKRAKARYWHDVDATRRRRRDLWAANPEPRRARGRNYARSERGRQNNRRAVAKWQAANPEKVAAHHEVQRALKRGELKRPDFCEVLGCSQPARHSHHHDYRKPRDVIFTCPQHHEKVHHSGPQKLKAGLKRRFARAPAPRTRTETEIRAR